MENNQIGKPAVVFENGMASGFGSWETVAAEISKTNAVFRYNRPRIGESENDSLPPTTEHIVSNLRKMLLQKGLRPPYLLVSHSFGGAYIRSFASTYPDEIAGLVFVDPIDFTKEKGFGDLPYLEIGLSQHQVDSMFGEPYDKFIEQLYKEMPGFYVEEVKISRALNATGFEECVRNPLPDVPVHFIMAGGYPENDDRGETIFDKKKLFRINNNLKMKRWIALLNPLKYGKFFYSSSSGHLIQVDDPKLVMYSIQLALTDYTEGTIINNTFGSALTPKEKLIPGSWIGAIKMGDENPDLVFNLFADSTGVLAGNLSVPAKGVKELPLSSVTIEGHTVTLAIEVAQARFTGVLDSYGSALEGNWQEGENTYPLLLKPLTENVDFAKLKHKNNSSLSLGLATAHFEFYSEEKDSRVLEDLAKELEKNYAKITGHMRTEFKEKIRVYIYPDLSAFHKAVNYPEAPDWVVGAAGKNELKMVSPLNPGSAHSYESLMRAIVHEFTHTVVLNIREHGAAGLPNWLNEGFAYYEADQLTTSQRRAVKSRILQKTIPGWDEIREANTSQFGEMGGYEISASIIEFLVQTYGSDKLNQFIITPGSVEKIYGMSESKLENMWMDYMIKNMNAQENDKI
jgi:pimeloyl-ACP methyl ester carboxylesterase